MNERISERGYFDYHFISLEPTRENRTVTVFDREATRSVLKWDEDDKKASPHPVPDWKARTAKWPVMQYVICDGEGEIVERIPVVGSRRAQCELAIRRIMVHIMARN